MRTKFTIFNYEIFLIDDGSTDNSLNKIKEIQNKPIKIIEHAKNKGYGAAIKTGLNYCKNNNSDIKIKQTKHLN